MADRAILSPGLKSPPPERDMKTASQRITLSGRLAVQDGIAKATGGPIDMYRARTRDEWKALLGRERYLVMRYRKFEPPGTGPYHDFEREACELDGLFVCYACKWVLFDIDAFQQTHSGWPAFTATLGEQVVKAYGDDTEGGMPFLEYFCAHCEGFLGKSLCTGGANTIQISGYAIELKKMSAEAKHTKLVELAIIPGDGRSANSKGGKISRGSSLKDLMRSSSNSAENSSRQASAEGKPKPAGRTSGILPYKFSGLAKSPDAAPRANSKNIAKPSLASPDGASSPSAETAKAPAQKKGLFSPRQASRNASTGGKP
ncbi:Uncharacterized protein FVE85_5383 [Porphyridium purpureum]|uniref:peptide-methionine (R)-S-oxide reductase n=1 Tax=Porphyridium purpureum TaxID=35688 RepID=A0A5J4Z3H0_PORPP|nr:Uncharacterized protein FVE85_5383 [Porphyridium purpureum]|eukprot:POR7168..scf295_1